MNLVLGSIIYLGLGLLTVRYIDRQSWFMRLNTVEALTLVYAALMAWPIVGPVTGAITLVKYLRENEQRSKNQ